MEHFIDETMPSFNHFEDSQMSPSFGEMMKEIPPLHAGANEKSSPAGKQIIGAGRTFKDYEDQMDSLKKENFNLKLRIYFLEEKMGTSSTDINAIKEDIELKVEIESLKTQLAEKQELLSQASKAFELIEEQKKIMSQEQLMYKKSLNEERVKISELEKELEMYKEKFVDCSSFYNETTEINSDVTLEIEKKSEEIASLEAQVEQMNNSLEEVCNWNKVLEKERNELKERLDSELRNKMSVHQKNKEIHRLQEEIITLKEEILKKDNQVEEYHKNMIEQNELLEEKSSLLEEKTKAYEKLVSSTEKRKQQIDDFWVSLKSIFADMNNKQRLLLTQFENDYLRLNNSPTNPSILNASDKSSKNGLHSPSTNEHVKLDQITDRLCWSPTLDITEIEEEATLQDDKDCYLKEIEKLNRLLQESNKKLLSVEKSYADKEKELKGQKQSHQKALETIRDLLYRYQTLEKSYNKLQKSYKELEKSYHGLVQKDEQPSRSNTNEDISSPLRRSHRNFSLESPKRDHYNKRRFDEMESKIDDLRCEIDTIKAEKNRLEEQIQTESEELQEKLQTREQTIDRLEYERDRIREELVAKISELNKLKDIYNSMPESPTRERKSLQQRIIEMNKELTEKDKQIEQLNKELQIKTQNLQKLVNTELWSKNKEIAKLHNHMTASQCQEKCRDSLQLTNLIRELNDIGINVKITNEVIQLNYINGNEEIDAKTMTDYIQKLVVQKKKLENEVDYLKWLKLVSKPDIIGEIQDGSEIDKVKRYCDLLKVHLKDLMKFMKNLLKSDDFYDEKHQKIIIEVLEKSQIISQDFVHALRDESNDENYFNNSAKVVRKSRSENTMDLFKNQLSNPSDSEVFSEPDRVVSMARMGLQEQQSSKRESPRSKSKHSKSFSESEDSMEDVSHHRISDCNDDCLIQIQGLKRTIGFLYTQLISLRNNFVEKVPIHDLTPLIEEVKKSQKYCENLQSIIDKKTHECHSLKKANKQHNSRKAQLEKKLTDIENMAHEITKQKTELVDYKENLDKKTTEILIGVNRENESLKLKVKKLEENTETSKSNISTLTKELDQLTLSHSRTLVENSKLTNDKLKLEHELRKSENMYDLVVHSLQEKCNKEINELNQIIDSHRDRMQELEVTNKELRRQVVASEESDSPPSSSGVSSMIPMESTSRPAFDDAIPEIQNYNGYYWWPMNVSSTNINTKTSCSPDLGIESDGAATSSRPLQEASKMTESMANLLSDNEQQCRLQNVNNESPLPTEGYEDIEALRQENEALKLRLTKTRKALEDTFRNLMTTNKNKKNVEKAIARHLVMTEDIWKKTKSYEQTFEHQ